MSTDHTVIASRVRATLAEGPVLLAVSGGMDSMVLLDSAATGARSAIVAVATFDHGTGEAATAAARLVVEEGARRGLPVIVGRGELRSATEAGWRDARWRFLRETALSVGASVIATAHTRDDQIETVAMRVLRSAGARGLAGLYAPTRGVARPLLDVSRGAVAAYAAAHDVRWVEDPSNGSVRHLRNRVRRDLLPALARTNADFSDALLAIARRAAEWRTDVEAFVDEHVPIRQGITGALHVATAALRGYDPERVAVLWAAIAARGGVRLDRRGTERLAQFTTRVAAGADVGAGIQLSGAVNVQAYRGEIVLRPGVLHERRRSGAAGETAVKLAGEIALGQWRFRRGGPAFGAPSWTAWLPIEARLSVRSWRPGDRMRVSATGAARRVKRFLSDARVASHDRAGWPVVLAGEEIVWIPGVRRSDAATDRPGRPGVLYICERIES